MKRTTAAISMAVMLALSGAAIGNGLEDIQITSKSVTGFSSSQSSTCNGNVCTVVTKTCRDGVCTEETETYDKEEVKADDAVASYVTPPSTLKAELQALDAETKKYFGRNLRKSRVIRSSRDVDQFLKKVYNDEVTVEEIQLVQKALEDAEAKVASRANRFSFTTDMDARRAAIAARRAARRAEMEARRAAMRQGDQPITEDPVDGGDDATEDPPLACDEGFAPNEDGTACEPVTEDPPLACDEGFVPNEDGTACEPVTEDPPLACDEGFVPNEDGTACEPAQAAIEFCETQEGSACTACQEGYVPTNEGALCSIAIEGCAVQEAATCTTCLEGFILSEDGTQCLIGDATGAKKFVALHNAARAKHGTGNVGWSSAVEESARKWAEVIASDCNVRHSTFEQRNGYGENLAWGHRSEEAAMRGWYDNEEPLYNYNNPGFGMSTGHFTQVVWKDTKNIGCVIMSLDHCRNVPSPLYICQYDPPGNYAGQFPENVPRPISS